MMKWNATIKKRQWHLSYYMVSLLVFTSCIYNANLAAASETPALFSKLLTEAGLEFKKPDGFNSAAIQTNSIFTYEHAIRHKSLALEARYTIRPIQRIKIDYQDPHNAAPEPNHLFPLLFSSIVDELSVDGNTPRREYPQEQASKLFNADWAAAAVFDTHPGLSKKYKQGLLIALHKNNRSDAYVIYLFDDYAQSKKEIDRSLASLRFNK